MFLHLILVFTGIGGWAFAKHTHTPNEVVAVLIKQMNFSLHIFYMKNKNLNIPTKSLLDHVEILFRRLICNNIGAGLNPEEPFFVKLDGNQKVDLQFKND